MKYRDVVSAIWLERVNRFVGRVCVQGREELVHVKNTGRLRELFVQGVEVALEVADEGKRKTRFSVIAVRLGERWVNVDSLAPNQVVGEALREGILPEFGQLAMVQREVQYKQSRFDIYYETADLRGFVEVKGVTLVSDGVAKFPDAPTERGTKHVEELVDAVKNGYQGTIFFLIQRENASLFTPHREMDPKFAEALALAARHGVQVLAYGCRVEADALYLGERVVVELAGPL